jgi:hypothetical protein
MIANAIDFCILFRRHDCPSRSTRGCACPCHRGRPSSKLGQLCAELSRALDDDAKRAGINAKIDAAIAQMKARKRPSSALTTAEQIVELLRAGAGGWQRADAIRDALPERTAISVQNKLAEMVRHGILEAEGQNANRRYRIAQPLGAAPS